MSEPLPIAVRRARSAEAAAIAQLIEPAFARFIACELGSVDRVAFRLYNTEKALRIRLALGVVAWCAELETGDPRLVGYAELHGPAGRPPGTDHLSLLFTAVEHQGRGIARALLGAVTAHLQSLEPLVTVLTVNASAYAVPIYERLGFRPTTPTEPLDAVAATPMRLALKPASPSAASPGPPPAASSARSASDRAAPGR